MGEEYEDKFEEILQEILEIHRAKSHDYSGEYDPYQNLRECEKVGIAAWRGVVVRMGDKWARIQNFAGTVGGELRVKDETILDTLKDLAAYAIIAAILYKEKED